MPREWFEDFFQGMALEMWRRENPPEKTSAEADFLAGVLGVGAGGRLLDVPCGNGRLAHALARRGSDVTGVDLAGECIAEARAATKAGGGQVAFHQQDMRQLPWREAFDGAYCFGNSFGYFDQNGTTAFLGAVSGALKPGARFVLDTAMAAESMLPTLEDRNWAPAGDITLLVEHRYDVARSRLDTEYTFIQEGRREKHSASHWIFTVGQIGHMVQANGLEVLSLFDSLEQTPYHVGAPRLLLVAEKSVAPPSDRK